MTSLLIEQQAFTKFDHVLPMSHLALFAVIKDQVPGLLPMGRQRRLSSRWFAEGFMYELGGKVLNHTSNYFSGFVLVHQVKSHPSTSAIIGSWAVSERVYVHSEQAAHLMQTHVSSHGRVVFLIFIPLLRYYLV